MGLRFKGKLVHPATVYVPIPMSAGGRLFIDVQWKDAVSSAAISFQTTGSDAADAPVDQAGAAWQWKTEADVTVTGPAAAAAGSTKVHTTAKCSRRARLMIVTAANCDLEIYSDSEHA